MINVPKEPVEVAEPLITAVFVGVNPLVKAPLICVAICPELLISPGTLGGSNN